MEPMSGAWRVEITRYTGGAQYRLMRFDECCGTFEDIETLVKFKELLKKDRWQRTRLPMREAYKKEYDACIAAIEEAEEQEHG